MKTNRVIMLLLALLGVTLVQNAQAFYNPSTGRWLSRDPIGEKGGINLYSFINNNSPNIVDRDGTTGWASFDSLPRCKPCKLSKSYDYSDKVFKDAVRTITSQSSYSLEEYEDALSNALNGVETPPNGPADKWRHCMFICITFRHASVLMAAGAAIISEIPWVGRGQSEPQDALANSYGFVAAHLPGSCSKNCACVTQEMPH
jgi:hypothetical protein